MENNNDLNLAQGKKQSTSEGGSGMKKIIMIAVGVLVLIGAGLGGYLFLQGGGDEEAETTEGGKKVEKQEQKNQEPIYYSMQKFVVNFNHNGELHYLQVEMQAMAYDQSAIDQLDKNIPAVRNSLIMLFSGQDFDQLATVEGKETLRADVKAAINESIHAGNGGIDDVFFTGFVMQ